MCLCACLILSDIYNRHFVNVCDKCIWVYMYVHVCVCALCMCVWVYMKTKN